jgi:acetyl esterase/lipase
MAEERHGQEIAKKAVVYQRNDTNAVTVQRDIPYARRDGEQLTLDVYHPAQQSSPPPAVLFVTGFPDAGMRRVVGCNAKDMASYISWAKLMAASGIVAITYTNRSPAIDAREVLRYVRENAASLGINDQRFGVWACSGNVPTALSVVMEEQPHIRCAAFCYGFMLDVHGSTDVADAARSFRFANPCDGKSPEELPRDVPLFIARAGRDECAGLNASIDRFLSRALALNLPVTLVNHHSAPHAFDIADDTDMSREVVRQILTFMRFHLRAHGWSG